MKRPKRPAPTQRRKTEDDLDEALKESFPASDPVSMSEPGLPEPPPKGAKTPGKKKSKR
jgi:hypothetical protein